MNLITLHNRICYNSAKGRGTDERFWTFFHQDCYRTVLCSKTTPVLKHQWVHIHYMRNKKDIHFNKILEACALHGITDLLQFRYNWNQEVITKFYSTHTFDKKETIFMWVTNGRRFNIKLAQFAQILGFSSHLDIIKKLHSERVMMPWEMTPMYILNSDFWVPKVDGLLPHFLVLYKMMKKTLAPRIGYSEAIPTYEQNLLDALMKLMRFDVFEYIVDEILNIATNPLRSFGFAPYIQYMIEVVAHEKFYKDVRHEPLCPVVPKDPRTHRIASPPPVVGPSRTTCSGGASSSSANSSFLKMFWGIFAICHRMDLCTDVMKQRLQIVWCNQVVVHSQQDEPLLEFPDVPVFPPIPDPYASPTPAELAAFGIGLARAPDDDNDDEEEANDDEEMENNM
jgi:hypothetical protein